MTFSKTEMIEPETKQRILDAAEELFANQGYKGAGVKSIAAKAGVTGAMINYYFDNKENLYHAVLDRITEDIRGLVKDILATGKPPAERLEIFYGWFFDYAAQHPNFSKLTKMGMGGPEKEHFQRLVKTFFKPMFEVAHGFFKKELRVRKMSDDDISHLLLSIYGQTITYFSDAEFMSVLLGRNALDPKELQKRKECLLDLIFKSIGVARIK